MAFSDMLQVVWFSLFALIALFAITKLLGNRQMSQLTMFDYIAGISIGSIAGEISTHPGKDAWMGLIALAVFAGFTLLLNLLNNKSIRLRRLLLGKPLVLYDHGTLYYNNLKKAKLDLTEFLTECRNAGYFDLAKLDLVLFEVNGRVSFLPMEGDRPLTPLDMQLDVKQARPAITVIMDGVIQAESLTATGNNEIWLRKQMNIQGFKNEADIFLATVDADNNLALYEKNENEQSKSYYS